MTHHPIRTLPDGTRVYSNGTRYRPKKNSERKYRKRKPENENAILYQGEWYLPLPVLPDESRTAPLTRPDTDAYDHMAKPRKCRCDVCRRPEAQVWKDRWIRDGIRSGTLPPPPKPRRRKRRRPPDG